MKAAAVCMVLSFAVLACERTSDERPATPATAQLVRFPSGGTIPASFVRPAKPAASAPLSLTASDGTGLALTTISARAIVEDPLAITELHLEFENPEDRAIEGTFTITLPPSASVSRFAMKLQDRWQEGEVVERQAARVAYEDFLHKKQDPALLEQTAGNQFSARVFPIPAHAKKEIIVSYSEELAAGAPYRLGLAGLPRVEHLDAEVHVGEGGAAATLSRDGAVPEGDLVVERSALSGKDGLRSGRLAVVRVRPELDLPPDPLDDVLLLVDTSASRALGFDREIALVGDVTKRIASATGASRLVVAAFDQEVAPVFDGAPSAFGDAELDRMRARGALGASDLAKALVWARENAKGVHRVVVITDGVATAGPADAPDIEKEASALAAAGAVRADVVLVGGIRDEALARSLATDALPTAGLAIDGDLDASAIVDRLSRGVASKIPVSVAGATWSWPETIDGVVAGDEVLVYAELPEKEAVRVRVGQSEQPSPVLVEVAPKLLDRALGRAKIASLLPLAAGDGGGAVKQQIVELSMDHRVLSPFTAMLVLETEADYERFHIDHGSLADVMTIRDGRLAFVDGRRHPSGEGGAGRSGDDPLAPQEVWGAGLGHDPLSARGNMWGASIGPVGGEVLRGPPGGPPPDAPDASPGGVGIGNGAGRLSGSHRSQPPSVRMGAASVSGRLPSEVIARIVRMNFGRLRACYESGLRSDPNLAGTVRLRFTIGADGSVASVSTDTTFGSRDVTACLVRATGGLSFPQPDGGAVSVEYPLAFSPGESSAGTPSTADSGPSTNPPGDPASADERGEVAPSIAPYTGRFQTVMADLAKNDVAGARAEAEAWHASAPGDVLALVALGEEREAAGDAHGAARAYGSIIDLYASRADLRRFAGERLDRLDDAESLALAIDTFQKAVADRPDHPSSHRLLAYALVRAGRFSEAFDAIEAGLTRKYPSNRFRGVDRVLRDDAGLVGAAWIAHEPAKREDVLARVEKLGAKVAAAPSLRFVLTWETDANDVDLHVLDSNGGHAYYASPHLPSGGDLYADVTTGYGPECFTVDLPAGARASKYMLRANYFARGPMGYGMGKVEIIEHDGKGGLTFEERPFVMMVDRAFVDLGATGNSLPAGDRPHTELARR